MNNPLEAVTQAVNSLVTALKLPDESAKANEVLGEMSFPQFSRLLPYRDYNQESGLFMNDTTMGFMLEAIPINGANESIVEALDHMLRTKLPRGIPLCIHLMSSQLVGDRIEYGLREFSWSGEQAERFNAITRAYYMKAAATQFPLPEGMNLPLTLRHYRVFISYCSPSKKKSRADILEMENLVKIIRASLQGASITTQTVDAQAFIDIVGEMINHNPDSLYPKRRQLDPYSDLNYQCVEDSFDLKVRADYLTLGLRESGRNSTARILNFHLARNPEIAFLWNMADNYSNLLNPELSISCPFILTLTLVVEDQVKTHSEANLKYMDLEKKSKTSYAKWFPSVEKEAKEWGELRQRLGSGQSSVVSYFLNITAFCKDNNETALEVEQDILNSFRKNGFELISPRFNHMRNFLTCLPFMAGKGLFKQLKEAGVVQRAESFNVANLMPLVADNPLTPAGLLAPTYRNQLAFIDIFFRGMNNTNYNMAVCGTSGAGKTGLIQPLIRSVLDSGGFAVVFDMGDGYKSLCENMGGVYLDGETLRFNPFANITDTPCCTGRTGGLVRVKVDDVLGDGDIGTGMTAGGTVAFLNKFTDLVIFEVQQTPAFINDVQFLEVTRRAVHPVLNVNDKAEHHRNQQGRTVFQSAQLQHHHFRIIPQGRLIGVEILAISAVSSVLVKQHNHFVQTAADGR